METLTDTSTSNISSLLDIMTQSLQPSHQAQPRGQIMAAMAKKIAKKSCEKPSLKFAELMGIC